MYQTQYRNHIPQNKCIGLNTITVFDNYSIKKQQIYVLDLIIPMTRKTNVFQTQTLYSTKNKNTCIGFQQEHMYQTLLFHEQQQELKKCTL